ncbi:MAG: putative recombinase [Caulobacter sp.]|nr:putative recombinase [Caulobacter sp.]
MTERYCVYKRVSTVRQGESGLGLEAQQRAVTEFLHSQAGTVVGEFEEVESGKEANRPQLLKAIEQCKLTGAKLLIAKLDRLSRSAHFLLGLEKAGIEFIACDMPHANRLTVGIMALVAQEEREAISRRTKAALGSVNATITREGHYVARSGRSITRLGNPNPPKMRLGSEAGVAAFQANADAFANRVAPSVRALLSAEGSMNKVAARLNEIGVKTARDGAWTAKAVQRVLDRTALAA